MATSKLNFTKRAIDALPAPKAGKRAFYRDTKVGGLGLRVTAAGTRTFVVYRKVAGRPQRLTIGRYPDWTIEKARKEAERLNGEIAGGNNPAVTRRARRCAATLGNLYDTYRDEYLEPRGMRLRGPDTQFRLYLARWSNRRTTDITRGDVKSLHAEIGRTNGAVTANRVHQLLRALLNWAIEEELLPGPNPAIGVKRFPETSRDRFLHPDEMRRFLRALAEEGNRDLRDFIFVALFTGARKDNVLSMRWQDVHLERGVWEIPHTKNGQPHAVPLVNALVELLEARMQTAKDEWVFPSRGKTGHLVEPKRAWASLLERAGISNLRIHDLRRTLGSWQASTGASLTVIGKTLAHVSPASTSIYARLNLDPVRASLNEATQAMVATAAEDAE